MADLVLGPFTVGIDQVSPDTKLPEGAVRDAVNGTFNRAGEFESRAGFELSYSAADIHSLWTDRAGNAFCGHGSQICSVRLGANGDPIVTPIYDTGSASPISLDDLLDSVVFANLGAVGSIRAGAFQPLAPSTPAQPVATAVSHGALAGGQYGVAVSVMGANESALSPITFVDVAEGGGIGLTFAAGTGNKLVYRTTQNGDVLYLAASLPEAITSYTLGNSEVGRMPETRNLAPLPTGHIVRYWRGRLLVASGNTVYFSEPMRYGLHSPREGFVQFASRVTMISPVDGGVFVGNESGVVFLTGTKPTDWSIDSTSALPPFEGSGLVVPSAVFGGELGKNGDNVAIWLSNNGFVMGTAQGQIIESQADRISLNEAGKASSFVHNRRITTIMQ